MFESPMSSGRGLGEQLLGKFRSSGVWAGLACLALASCAASGSKGDLGTDFVEGSNYSYAVYSNDHRLLHSPIGRLSYELEQRKLAATSSGEKPRPITDVYLISHGWNFTLEESAALYENYRLSLDSAVSRYQSKRKDFEPFFIFITWGSVSRPLTSALDSISPYQLPTLLRNTTTTIDTVAFHIPSNWGETKEALNIALGDGDRMNDFNPRAYEPSPKESDYSRALAREIGRVKSEPFEGYQVSVSTLVDQLLRIKYEENTPAFRLHTVGHSFGGKLISLATLDASSRIRAAKLVGAGPTWVQEEQYVDSMVLINPAMKPSEMYFPVTLALEPEECERLIKEDEIFGSDLLGYSPAFRPIAESVTRKGLAYSRHDSANGWVFSLSQMALSYDALAEQGFDRDWHPFFQLPGWILSLGGAVVQTAFTDLAAFTLEPIDALVGAFTGYESVPGFAIDLMRVPLAPFKSQASTGSQGFRKIAALSGGARQTSWLTSDARTYLNGSHEVGSKDFLEISGSLGMDANVHESLYTVYDAKRVYNGHMASLGNFFGGILNQFDPSAAHGDVRSYTKVDGLQKRERTFLWIFNLSHSTPVATAMKGSKVVASTPID